MYYEGLILVFIYLIIGMVLFFSALKPNVKNKKFPLFVGALLIGLAFFVLFAAIEEKKGLVAASVCIPLGVFVIWLSLHPIFLFNKCTLSVTAKLMGEDYERRGRGGGWAPIFKYKYRDSDITSKPFVLYSKRKLDRLYPKSNKRGYTFTKPEYNVFIDPSNPARCVDKREFPFGFCIAFAVFGLVFVLFGIYLPLAV